MYEGVHLLTSLSIQEINLSLYYLPVCYLRDYLPFLWVFAQIILLTIRTCFNIEKRRYSNDLMKKSLHVFCLSRDNRWENDFLCEGHMIIFILVVQLRRYNHMNPFFKYLFRFSQIVISDTMYEALRSLAKGDNTLDWTLKIKNDLLFWTFIHKVN